MGVEGLNQPSPKMLPTLGHSHNLSCHGVDFQNFLKRTALLISYYLGGERNSAGTNTVVEWTKGIQLVSKFQPALLYSFSIDKFGKFFSCIHTGEKPEGKSKKEKSPKSKKSEKKEKKSETKKEKTPPKKGTKREVKKPSPQGK